MDVQYSANIHARFDVIQHAARYWKKINLVNGKERSGASVFRLKKKRKIKSNFSIERAILGGHDFAKSLQVGLVSKSGG